ncbi:MFS general substrate transporter [Gloeophyllum trabeum ATCC 11539]|uniref:MFS general substrate transporter n=1 Tax=Gloeophyllum trabeum (strain ATCC 11539 / FP-39264 / Madison 617) TaxID=670483 RepID=S7Q2B4_GLOTA|nr:MFS general substrate transporter [Gloeophyllum trabeum ATCC 11539]EPQ53692.1 MFS general substrate transporter [Gloeophyllum trabeum ATCC 11539]
MLGLVCFTCAGLYNAMTGLGGAGQVDPRTSANANSALYAALALLSVFAGSVMNMLGPRLTLFLGTTGYVLGLISYLVININPNAGWFVITAGGIEGLCAALLWTAQSTLMMAYPTDSQRGRFISIFWAIYNLGGVVGATVSLGENIHLKVCTMLIGLITLNTVGMAVPLIMVDPNRMYRSDGTKVTTPRRPSWRSELHSLYFSLKSDPMVLLLFPMFFASNWYFTWQFNDYNAALFNIRTRSLNNLVYWVSTILGSILIGFVLDQRGLTRRLRAFYGWGILISLTFIVHVWAFIYQRNYTRESIPVNSLKMDIFDKGYAGRVLLYGFCGALGAMYQSFVYWIMGAMTDDPAKLAYYAGFYHSMQSAGAAGAFGADAVGLPYVYMNIFLSTWVLLVAGLVVALPMLYFRVRNASDDTGCSE